MKIRIKDIEKSRYRGFGTKKMGQSPILQFSNVTKGGKTVSSVVETSIKTKKEYQNIPRI